jgi:hypothetical protein
MEFDDVVLINFFSGLPSGMQDWWKKRLQNPSATPVAETEVGVICINFSLIVFQLLLFGNF